MVQSKISAVIILGGENLQSKDSTTPYDFDLAILPILPMLSSPVLHKRALLAQQSFPPGEIILRKLSNSHFQGTPTTKLSVDLRLGSSRL